MLLASDSSSPGDNMAARLINELSGVQARMSQVVLQRKICCTLMHEIQMIESQHLQHIFWPIASSCKQASSEIVILVLPFFVRAIVGNTGSFSNRGL